MYKGLPNSNIHPFSKYLWSTCQALCWCWGHSGEQGRLMVEADRDKSYDAGQRGCSGDET